MTPYTRKINYYETDKMGITHHSNYIRFMEEARIDFLEQTGCGYDKIEKYGIVSPVVNITCNYKRMTTFNDTIVIFVSLVSITPAKLVFEYKITLNSEVVFTANSTHCFLKNGKPVNIQRACPELYDKLSESNIKTVINRI